MGRGKLKAFHNTSALCRVLSQLSSHLSITIYLTKQLAALQGWRGGEAPSAICIQVSPHTAARVWLQVPYPSRGTWWGFAPLLQPKGCSDGSSGKSLAPMSLSFLPPWLPLVGFFYFFLLIWPVLWLLALLFQGWQSVPFFTFVCSQAAHEKHFVCKHVLSTSPKAPVLSDTPTAPLCTGTFDVSRVTRAGTSIPQGSRGFADSGRQARLCEGW